MGDNELVECATQDMGITEEQLATRWVDPFQFITDVFQYRNMEGEYVPYTPYDYAVDFMKAGFYSPDIDRCVLKGRQIGISTTSELEAIETAMTFDNQEVSMISNQKKNAVKLVVAAGQMITEAKYPLPVQKRNIQKESIKFDNGSSIVAYSSKPSSLRSDKSIRIYLDEFASVKDQEEMMAAIAPKLSRGGSWTMISTPLRKDDVFMNTYNGMVDGSMDGTPFFYPLFKEGEVDLTRPLTSQKLNPLCPDILLKRPEDTRRRSINEFMQEYMGVPVDETNAYYPYDMILECAKYEPTYIRDAPDSMVIMGLDHALVHDETSFVINQIINGVNNIVWVETTQADYHDQLKRAEHLFRQFNVQKIRVDATGEMGVQVERDLRKTFGYCVEGVKYNNQNKGEMAMRLKYLMQNTVAGLKPCIHMPDNPDLISQLHGIQIKITASGNTQYSGKKGGGLDDIVNAEWLSIPPETVDHMKSTPVVRSEIAPQIRNKSTNKHSNMAVVSKGTVKYRKKGRR